MNIIPKLPLMTVPIHLTRHLAPLLQTNHPVNLAGAGLIDEREGEMPMPRILVIDDSPTVLYMVTEMITQGGHETITATNGEQALYMAINQQPDLVLLDVILPKLNGYEVCRQLKSTPQTADIPVVMITSKTRDKDREWGIEQGADDYITKPFDADDLLDIINRFVRGRVGTES